MMIKQYISNQSCHLLRSPKQSNNKVFYIKWIFRERPSISFFSEGFWVSQWLQFSETCWQVKVSDGRQFKVFLAKHTSTKPNKRPNGYIAHLKTNFYKFYKISFIKRCFLPMLIKIGPRFFRKWGRCE